MPLPGSEVTIIEELPARSAAIDTGAGFLAAIAERGPLDRAVEVRSVRQLRRTFGEIVNYSELEAHAQAFFSRGGSKLFVGRVAGPAPLNATGALSDGATGDALTVTAVNAGAWGDAIDVEFTYDTGDLTAVVKYNDVEVENSGVQDGKTGIAAWSLTSEYVRITDGGGGNPTSATVALTGGDDDHANITTAEWQLALDLFVAELGPGQVMIPAVSTTAVHALLLAHAEANNRFALCDGVDDVATNLATASADRATGKGRYGTIVAPEVLESNATRAGSPYVAGRLAFTDRTAGPGQYAAGSIYGEIGGAAASVDYTDDERANLNDAGVQVIRNMTGGGRIYGFRTLAEEDSPYTEAAHARVIMSLRADLETVLEEYVLRKVDGRGLLLSQLAGDLAAVCLRYYNPPRNDLFGATPQEAFRVDTGSAINTPETLASNELHAAVAVRISPGAERVYLTLTKAATADSLA